MSVELEGKTNLPKNYPSPKITYEEHQNPSFYLEIDEKLLGELFQEIGMSPEQASLTKVIVFESEADFKEAEVPAYKLAPFFKKIVNLPTPNATARVRPDKEGFHYIHLNEQRIFKSLQDTMKFFSNFAKNKDKKKIFLGRIKMKLEEESIKESANLLFISKRMLPYLKSADEERASKFLDRIFPLVLHRDLIGTLAHEGQHIYDIKNDRFFRVKTILPFFVWYLSATRTYDYLLAGAKDADWLSAGIASAFSFVLAWRINQWIGIESRAETKGREMGVKSKYDDLVYIELNEQKVLPKEKSKPQKSQLSFW